VRGVVRWAYGIGVTERQAETLAKSNWKRLKLAIARGRPISRVFRILEKMADGETAESLPKDSSAKGEIRPKSLAGYGEAKDWVSI